MSNKSDHKPALSFNRRTFLKWSAIAGTVAVSAGASSSSSVEQIRINRSRVRPGAEVKVTVVSGPSEHRDVWIVDFAENQVGDVIAKLPLVCEGGTCWTSSWTVSVDRTHTSSLRVVALVVDEGVAVVSSPLEVVLTPLGWV